MDLVHVQKIKEIELGEKSYGCNNKLVFKNNDIDGSIIIQMKNGIPAVVGIQIN
jgi:hypothetical protein